MMILRRFCALAVAGGLASAAATCQADYFTTTIDANGATPSGLQRFDELTGVRLTAGEVAPFSVGGSSPFGPYGPTDIVAGADGYVYVSDGFTGSVFRFEQQDGSLAPPPNEFSLPGLFAQRATQAPGLSFASLTFDDMGLLYVLDSYDVTDVPETTDPKPGIRIFNSSGFQVDTLLEAEAATLSSLSSIQFDSFGDLLISDRDTATIYRLDIGTDTLSVFNTGGAIGPAGIAVAENGEVFVADLFGNRIVKFDSDGTNPQTFAALDPVLVSPFSNFPSDLVFDADGNLIVAVLGKDNPGPDGTAAGTLLKYDSSGTLIQTIASGLRPTSSVAIVEDLLPADFDGDGLVAVADYEVWQQAFGDSVTPNSGADANGDGVVDAADYTIWRDTLGESGILEVPPAAAAVPEPGTLLLALGLAGFRLRRR